MKPLTGPIELIKRSFKIFFKRKNLVYFFKIYSPLAVLAAVSFFQSSFLNFRLRQLNTPELYLTLAQNPILILPSLGLGILDIIIGVWIGVAGIKAADGVVRGIILPVKEVYSFAWRKAWGFFLLGAMLSLIILGGAILLIIPGIIFSVWFYFSKFIYIYDGLEIKESLRRSKELVAGRFWPVTGRLFVIGLLMGILQLLVSGVPFLGYILSPLLGALTLLPSYFLYSEIKER